MALDLSAQSRDEGTELRRVAIDSLVLVHDAANAAHDIRAAIDALERAAALVDAAKEPLLWAELHESLARIAADYPPQ